MNLLTHNGRKERFLSNRQGILLPPGHHVKRKSTFRPGATSVRKQGWAGLNRHSEGRRGGIAAGEAALRAALRRRFTRAMITATSATAPCSSTRPVIMTTWASKRASGSLNFAPATCRLFTDRSGACQGRAEEEMTKAERINTKARRTQRGSSHRWTRMDIDEGGSPNSTFAIALAAKDAKVVDRSGEESYHEDTKGTKRRVVIAKERSDCGNLPSSDLQLPICNLQSERVRRVGRRSQKVECRR